MPLVGSSRMMTRGFVASHLAMTTFCWLPPESSATSWSRAAARRSRRAVYSRVRRNSSARRRKPRREMRSSEGRVTFWKIGRPRMRALLAAVLGHVDDAAGDGVGGGADDGDAAVDLDDALRGPGGAEERLHELAAAGADEAVEAEDLALAQGEADGVELGRVAVAGDLEHLRAGSAWLLGEDRVDRAADHQADEVGLGDSRHEALADHLAVAEDGVAVGDAEDLVELVAR